MCGYMPFEFLMTTIIIINVITVSTSSSYVHTIQRTRIARRAFVSKSIFVATKDTCWTFLCTTLSMNAIIPISDSNGHSSLGTARPTAEDNISSSNGTTHNNCQEETAAGVLPLDWDPQEKCYLCKDGKPLSANEGAQLSPLMGLGKQGTEPVSTCRVFELQSSFVFIRTFFTSDIVGQRQRLQRHWN